MGERKLHPVNAGMKVGMGFKLDLREIDWAPYVMIGAASASALSCSRSLSSSTAKAPGLWSAH